VELAGESSCQDHFVFFEDAKTEEGDENSLAPKQPGSEWKEGAALC